MIALLLVVLAGQISSACADSRPAAMGALETLKELASDAKRPNQFGFESAAEVGDAQLGRPLAMVTLQQSKLTRYRAGQSIESMLDAPDEVIYPVLVKDAPRAAIHVRRSGKAWKVGGFTDAPLMRALARAGSADPDYFVIQIPALNCLAAAWRENGVLWVVPVPQPNADWGVPTWSKMTAADFFRAMAPRTKQRSRGPS